MLAFDLIESERSPPKCFTAPKKGIKPSQHFLDKMKIENLATIPAGSGWNGPPPSEQSRAAFDLKVAWKENLSSATFGIGQRQSYQDRTKFTTFRRYPSRVHFKLKCLGPKHSNPNKWNIGHLRFLFIHHLHDHLVEHNLYHLIQQDTLFWQECHQVARSWEEIRKCHGWPDPLSRC